jgi:hypothetical protein
MKIAVATLAILLTGCETAIRSPVELDITVKIHLLPPDSIPLVDDSRPFQARGAATKDQIWVEGSTQDGKAWTDL